MIERYSGYKRLLALAALTGGAAAIERTATGNPATFETDLARPLKSLLIPFTPQQSGTGDPSPQNVRPIVPWDGLTVFGGGANIFDLSSYDWNNTVSANPIYTLNTDGSITVIRNDDRSWSAVAELTGLKKGKYVLQWTGSGTIRARYRQGSGTMTSVDGALPFTIDDNTQKNIIIKIFPDEYPATGNVQIVFGEEAKPYEAPHITETDIVFPSPVYGGEHEAVSGKLINNRYPVNITPQEVPEIYIDTVASAFVTIYIQYAPNHIPSVVGNTVISNRFSRKIASGNAGRMVQGNAGVYLVLPADEMSGTDMEAVREWFANNPTILVFELATPTEQTLTGHQITALLGQNTIWSDADGSMTAVYLVSESFAENHPISGGLGSGLLGDGLGSGTGEPDEPDEPVEPDEPGEPDQPDEPAEPDQPGDE